MSSVAVVAPRTKEPQNADGSSADAPRRRVITLNRRAEDRAPPQRSNGREIDRARDRQPDRQRDAPRSDRDVDRFRGDSKRDSGNSSVAQGVPSGKRVAARYFIIKCNDQKNLDKSIRENIWATQRRNEHKLNDAYDVSDRVLI